MCGHSSIHFGSKKYTVFICWSKLNKVGVEVHMFSWPSGLNHVLKLHFSRFMTRKANLLKLFSKNEYKGKM